MTAAPVNNTLHFICMACGREYKTLQVERDLGALDRSHGWCPECLPAVEAKWYGRKP